VREIRINPSSAGWAVGNQVITEYSSGCLRHLLLKNYLPIPFNLPEDLIKVGADGEDKYQNYLDNEQEYPYHKECVMKSTMDGVTVSGRIDFLSHHEKFRVVHECKSSKSKNLLYKVIRKGEVKLSHLAQLVFYLIHLNETRGKLIVWYEPTNETRVFKVVIGEGGEIFIDGVRHTFDVAEQIQHQLLSAKVIKENILWDRPNGAACKYCDYNKICTKYDESGLTFTEFMETNNV